jgi:CheY-like chemotaxis protein
MEEVAELLAYRAQEKGLELACDVPPDFPERLKGDPGRIRQILTNLVSNAIKFTEAGEVKLSAKIVGSTASFAKLRLEVADTGIGIPKDRQDAVFDSFTQADGSTTRRYGGTGLGLTISRQLTQLMGGKIGLVSKPGKGSTFFVEISLAKQSGEALRAKVPGTVRGLRVLIVDDNATNRYILREQLKSWGCEPYETTGGADALKALRREPPFGLILMDYQMPDMDGEETARRIRADKRYEAIPLVLLTSVCSRATLAEMRTKGFSAALTKPVRQSHLLETICDVLGLSPLIEAPVHGSLATEHTQLNLRVLLAEDNPVNQTVALHLLGRWGCQTTAVGTGRQALGALETGEFDLVLMDVQMPEMDGLEATAAIRLRETKTGSHVPILAMTAHAMEGDRERCLSAGMDGYLSKPVRPQEFFEALQTWSARAARQQAA